MFGRLDGPGRFTVLVLGTLAVLSAAAPAVPTVVDYGPFTVSFYNSGDSDGSATSEQDWTQTQMDDVAAAIESWDMWINNTPGRQIKLHIFWREFGTEGNDRYILGGSYSPTYGDNSTSWSYPEHIWRDGSDYNGAWDGWDTTIQLDVTAGSKAWNFGDGATYSSLIDFRSVLAHELGHSIGFSDSYSSSNDKWGNVYGTRFNPYSYNGTKGLREWEKTFVDQNGNTPKNNSTGDPGNFDETGTVHYTGANAVAYYGGNVPIYAPDTYSSSSSLCHLEEYISPEPLMSPQLQPAEMIRNPSMLEIEILKDMGYDVGIWPTFTGDADRDADVDNIDMGTLYGNFTGPEGIQMAWPQGNFDDDGDVDNIDFGALYGNFTGPGAGNATDTGDRADLIYDAATGNVKLDPSEAAGGVITNWAFENASAAFSSPGVVVFPTVGFGLETDTAGQISQTDVTMAGFGYLADIGNIFPTGLTLEALQSLLTTASYVGTVGSGQVDFDLIVIPEPATLALVGVGACLLLLRRRR